VTADKLGRYALWIVAIGIVGGVFRYLMRSILIGVSRKIEYDLRNDFFAHLLTQPQTFYQARQTGDLMSRATSDMNAVRMVLGPGIMQGRTRSSSRRGVILMLISPPDAGRAPAASALSFSVAAIGIASTRFEDIQAHFARFGVFAGELAGVRWCALRAGGAAIARFSELTHGTC
jgi:ATP-binding cassette subfamily B protein